MVVKPIKDSPAEQAGIRAGDIVTAVNGTSVNGSTMSDQIAKVRGKAGTDVTLGIKRGASTLSVTVTRAEITMSEVETRMLDNDIGYIALHGFSESSPDQFHQELKGLLDGPQKIIFDLRGNPGGYIEAARTIASEFVDTGTVFTQESAGDAKTWTALPDYGLATKPSIPVVVLVDNGSASASEIVSAALKELGRATIIGQHTFGKNTVQVWAPLENDGGVRITISRWSATTTAFIRMACSRTSWSMCRPERRQNRTSRCSARSRSWTSAQWEHSRRHRPAPRHRSRLRRPARPATTPPG